MNYLKKIDEKDIINRNNFYLLNDLVEIHNAVQEEIREVKKGKLLTIKLIIMKGILLEFWISLFFMFPYIGGLKIVFGIEITLFMSGYIFLSLIGLFYYFNRAAIKRVNTRAYLKRLISLKNKINREMNSIDFDKPNVFVLSNIEEVLLIDPEIRIVKLKYLPDIVGFQKFELVKYSILTCLYFSLVGLVLWLLMSV